jgi:CubicO group peptidase (beta-lactamase class C family)
MIAIAFLASAAAPLPDTPQHGVRMIATTDARSIARGVSDPRTGRTATLDDPVRIASVSKLAVAMAVLRLEGQGKLDIDADVSQWLGWQIHNPAWPNRKITLRLLLSHQSSLTDRADYLIPLGETVRERLDKPGVWDAEHAPGTYFRYSNLNFPVIASVMEAATGKRFDQIMTDTLFKPARIRACFNWSGCGPREFARAVVMRDPEGNIVRDDLQGKPPPCPVVPRADGNCDLSTYKPGENGALFSPQGGMRISVRELAKIAKLIGNPAALKRLKIDPVELTAPNWTFDGSNGDSEGGVFCTYGLAVHFLNANPHSGCKDDLFGDGKLRFGHSGEAYKLRSGVWTDPKSRKGVAFFATGLPGTLPNGVSAFTTEEEAMAKASMRLPRK